MSQEYTFKKPENFLNSEYSQRGIKPLSDESVKYNPKDKSVYETIIGTTSFFKENKILEVPELVAAANSYHKDGDMKVDKFDKASVCQGKYQALYDSYNDNYDYIEELRKAGFNQDAVINLMARGGGNLLATAAATGGGGSGPIHPQNLKVIEKLNVLSGVMVLGERSFASQKAFPEKVVEFIKGSFFKRKPMKAQYPIKTGTPITSSSVEIEDQTYEIFGIGAHVAKHWELKLLPFYLDPVQESIDAVAHAVEEKKAELTTPVVEGSGITPVNANPSTWDAITGGESSSNPVMDIDARMYDITKNGGKASRAFCSPKTWAALESNRWANNASQASVITEMGQAKQVQWRGLLVTVDPLGADDIFTIYSNNAGRTYLGTKEVFDYEDVRTRTQGQYFLEYYGSQRTNVLDFAIVGNTLA